MEHNNRKKGLKADYTAWCSSDIKAAIPLERILNEINDPKLTTKINSTLSSFNKTCKDLILIKTTLNIGVQQMINFYYHEYKKNIKLCDYPYLVESHLLNIINAKKNKVIYE